MEERRAVAKMERTGRERARADGLRERRAREEGKKERDRKEERKQGATIRRGMPRTMYYTYQ
jgi:hypothetical protein